MDIRSDTLVHEPEGLIDLWVGLVATRNRVGRRVEEDPEHVIE